jgi:hypothetical protein
VVVHFYPLQNVTAFEAMSPRDLIRGGKPAGVIPGNIRFSTDQTAQPWHQGYCAMNYEAMNLMYELIFAAYALTGDPEIEKGITEPPPTKELLKPDGTGRR